MTNVKHCENHRKAKSNNKASTKQIGKNFLMIAFPIWKRYIKKCAPCTASCTFRFTHPSGKAILSHIRRKFKM